MTCSKKTFQYNYGPVELISSHSFHKWVTNAQKSGCNEKLSPSDLWKNAKKILATED